MTVGELIEELKKYDPSLPVASSGADFGGYDVVDGINVFVEERAPSRHTAPDDYRSKRHVYIAHED